MMSPDKHAISVIVGRLAPKGPESEGEESGEGNSQGLEAAAEDLIVAVGERNAPGVVEALRNAFSILDSEPHEEGEHTEEEGAEVA